MSSSIPSVANSTGLPTLLGEAVKRVDRGTPSPARNETVHQHDVDVVVLGDGSDNIAEGRHRPAGIDRITGVGDAWEEFVDPASCLGVSSGSLSTMTLDTVSDDDARPRLCGDDADVRAVRVGRVGERRGSIEEIVRRVYRWHAVLSKPGDVRNRGRP